MSVIPLRPAKGQGSGASAVRPRSTVSLTPTESMRLRAALRNMRGLFGTWRCLAAAMGVRPKLLENFLYGTRNGSPGLALAAARAVGTTVDRLISDAPTDAAKCPHCGRGAS